MSFMGPNPLTLPNLKNIEFSVKSSGASSILLSDQNKFVEAQNGASVATITVEPDSTTELPVGSFFYTGKTGSAEVTYSRGSGVAFGSALGDVDFKIDGLADEGAWIMFLKRDVDFWYVSGPIKPV